MRISRSCGFLLVGMGIAWACGFDQTLRGYLSLQFWLPFAKRYAFFEKPGVERMNVPFAGMAAGAGESPLRKLRAGYQKISQPVEDTFDVTALRQGVEAARADSSLTEWEREEVELIDAKIDMRCGQPREPALLHSSQKKLEAFLRTARTPELLSEARGWLARVYFLLGNQTAAGKIYLDELNRSGSNLSRETLLVSLRINYGYDGGRELLAHLEEYFDTAEHAAFAIQLVTNPHWHREHQGFDPPDEVSQSYPRVKQLLEKHRELLATNSGANALALLAMRTALRMGEPAEARRIGGAVPAKAAIRSEPDFHWMLASAYFLTREYAAAERPLLAVFRSPQSSEGQKAAAAYGLCGVYRKSKNVKEQLRFALWPRATVNRSPDLRDYDTGISDLSVYWAVDGWDLNMLLEAEASIEALETFIRENPNVSNIRVVKYSLAVRLARENRYEEAAGVYESIQEKRRALRMRRMAALYSEANQGGLTNSERHEASYRLAEYIQENQERIYFNYTLWQGQQRYALYADSDSRLTRAEREAMMARERKLKDDQEERWRAYLILRGVMKEAGETEMGREAAALALRCVRGIHRDRFGRREELRKADSELTARLKNRTGN